jgi:hypothetical protein
MLIVKPKGRGNWKPMRVTFEGKHAQALSGQIVLRRGSTFELGGIVWRVCEVRA